MTIYGKMGPYIFPQKERNEVPLKKLPTGIYTVEYIPMQGFCLKECNDFVMSGKIYGNLENRTNRIINTYLDRAKKHISTGVLLTGIKGSGKTLLVKNLAKEFLPMGISTIIVNSPFCGTEFNNFMATFEEPVCVTFDEYEKVYHEPQAQEQLLTLFDGIFASNMLFILTCNKKHLVDDNMINRPGRIFYNYDYSGLDETFVREYLEENLKDKSQIEPFVRYVSNNIQELNFDMMKAMVEEMNRYDETLKEVVTHLNVSTYGVKKLYTVVNWTSLHAFPKTIEGYHAKCKDFKITKFHDSPHDRLNIYKDTVSINMEYTFVDEDGDICDDEHYIQFTSEHIVSVTNERITMENSDFRIILEEAKPEKGKDYWDYQSPYM